MGLLGGFIWIAEKVREQAEAELYDAAPVRQAMSDLYRELETGAITEEEFEKQEAELVARLAAIEEATRGAPNDNDADDDDDDEADDERGDVRGK